MVAVALGALVVFVVLVAYLACRKPNPHSPETPPEPRTRPATPTGRIPLGPGEDFHFDIVGAGSYLATLRKAAGDRLANGETVVLTALVIPEPNNQYDPNAIAVHLEGFGKVGYFSRGDAEEWRAVAQALIARGAVGTCEAWLMGGTAEKKNIGVRLSLKEPDEIEEDLGLRADE